MSTYSTTSSSTLFLSNPVYNRYPTLNVNSKNNKTTEIIPAIVIKIGICLHWSNSRYPPSDRTSKLHLQATQRHVDEFGFHFLAGPNINDGTNNPGISVPEGPPTQKCNNNSFKWWVSQRSFRMTFWILSLWKGSKISQRGQRKSVNGPWIHLNSPFGSP